MSHLISVRDVPRERRPKIASRASGDFLQKETETGVIVHDKLIVIAMEISGPSQLGNAMEGE